MKTYILKYVVYNNIDFPAGTIVTITDDYWGKTGNDKNTGFTVIEGKLKGKRGCVADGLNGCLLDDTIKNRKLFKQFKDETNRLQVSMNRLNKRWDSLPTSDITSK